jgi:hypothetical protein
MLRVYIDVSSSDRSKSGKDLHVIKMAVIENCPAISDL